MIFFINIIIFKLSLIYFLLNLIDYIKIGYLQFFIIIFTILITFFIAYKNIISY